MAIDIHINNIYWTTVPDRQDVEKLIDDILVGNRWHPGRENFLDTCESDKEAIDPAERLWHVVWQLGHAGYDVIPITDDHISRTMKSSGLEVTWQKFESDYLDAYVIAPTAQLAIELLRLSMLSRKRDNHDN